MTKRSKQVVFALAALATGFGLGVSARPEAFAQGIQLRVAPAARLVKATGGARLAPQGEAPFQPVKALTAEQRRTLLASLDLPTAPGHVYFRVTPGTPNVPDKGGLVFMNAYLVEPMNGYARWSIREPLPNLGPVLWIHSEGAGRRYFVDCAGRAPSNTAVHVTGPGGLDQTVNGGQAEMHMTWVLEASNGEWYGYNMTPQRVAPGGFGGFELQSCDVTAL